MSTTYDADVIIIGYGPSGVAAANALGTAGVTAIAFERDVDLYARARAVTVNDWTMRLFQSVGLDARVKEDMDPTVALRWVTYDGRELLNTGFPPGQLGHATSYAIYQPLMEAKLREGACRFGDKVQVSYGQEVTDLVQDADGVTVTVRELATDETRTVRARYALAADGGSSVTRERLGIPMLGDTLDVRWAVIDGKVKRWWPNRHILTFWSDAERPVVDIALGRDNHRWEIPLNPGEADADFDSAEKIWPLLESVGVTHEDVDIHGFAFYSHHIRFAERWREGRVFLLGDACHLMPPWAGSGMQSGIRDAFNIAWKLAAVLEGRLHESLLDSYEAERRPNVEFYTGVSIQLGRIIKQEITAEEAAEMQRSQEAGELPPLLWPPTYPAGWFTGVQPGPMGVPQTVVGQMIPQPRAADTHGLIGPLNDLIGNGFVVLGDGVDPKTVMAAAEVDAWSAAGARFLTVRTADQGTEAADEIVDIDGGLVAWLRERGARVVVVRPDRFVAAADTTGLALPA
jgi:3-(3-hydroxy-phenyl)propionate hydroxylase